MNLFFYRKIPYSDKSPSGTQSALYLALLKRKKATVLDLFRETGIQRPTIYDALETLEQFGLIMRIAEGAKKFILPSHPKNITLYLAKKRKLAEELLPALADIYNKENVLPPKIRFFQGEEGLKKLSEVILTSKNKLIRTIADYDQNIQQSFAKNFLRSLWASRSRKHIFGHILYTTKSIPQLRKNPDYGEIGNIRYNREVRILPAEIDINILYTLVDDNVLFWSSKKEGYSFHIQSPSYANSLKSLFDFLWAQSQKFPENLQKIQTKSPIA